jgi:hypothetical protein
MLFRYFCVPTTRRAPSGDMGVAGSTQRLRPMVNPDGKVGLKVRRECELNAILRLSFIPPNYNDPMG